MKLASSDAAAHRAQWIDAQNRVTQAETALEISTLQANAAEAAVREARALRGKAEVLVDPVKTFRRAIETRQADLERLKKGQPGSSPETQEQAQPNQRADRRVGPNARVPEDGGSRRSFPTKRLPHSSAGEGSLERCLLDLERTTVTAPAEGIVANFQLTGGDLYPTRNTCRNPHRHDALAAGCGRAGELVREDPPRRQGLLQPPQLSRAPPYRQGGVCRPRRRSGARSSQW